MVTFSLCAIVVHVLQIGTQNMAAKVNKDYISTATDVACGNRSRMLNFILHLLLIIPAIWLVTQRRYQVGYFSELVRNELNHLIKVMKVPYKKLSERQEMCLKALEIIDKLDLLLLEIGRMLAERGKIHQSIFQSVDKYLEDIKQVIRMLYDKREEEKDKKREKQREKIFYLGEVAYAIDTTWQVQESKLLDWAVIDIPFFQKKLALRRYEDRYSLWQDLVWKLTISVTGEAIASLNLGWQLFDNDKYPDFKYANIFGFQPDEQGTKAAGHIEYQRNSRNFCGHSLFKSEGCGDLKECQYHFDRSIEFILRYFSDEKVA